MPKTYVVTGGASGIGAATTALLRERGHRVITVDLQDADVVADLSRPDGRREAVKGVQKLTPVLHGIVPCAGLAPLTGRDPALLAAVNYFGAVEVVDGLLPILVEGSAVVLLSSNSVTVQPGWPASLAKTLLKGDEFTALKQAASTPVVMVYPASKAALAWWARKNAPRLARHGVRVNAIAPGLIDTPMSDGVKKDPVFGRFASTYPTILDRPGRPEEVARLIAFLLSEESSLIVGATILVDGGTDALTNKYAPAGRATGRVASTAAGGALNLAAKAMSSDPVRKAMRRAKKR
ncbi:MAG: SDR family oxidoreductase [Marmoricola sp.]